MSGHFFDYSHLKKSRLRDVWHWPNKVTADFTDFYRATCMHSADYAVARCPSVCLSVCLSEAEMNLYSALSRTRLWCATASRTSALIIGWHPLIISHQRRSVSATAELLVLSRANIAIPSVCLSVCLSVAFWYTMETV